MILDIPEIDRHLTRQSFKDSVVQGGTAMGITTGFYKQVKRDLTGPCNICGQVTTLTWDHTPPKNCGNKYPAKINSFYGEWKGNESVPPDAQNGIKFRTICSRCNSGLLGGEYDRALFEYANSIHLLLASGESIPRIVSIKAQINRLCRAVCGHMLSSIAFFDDQNLIDVGLRSYFLDQSALPPENFHLLNWVYLYKSIAIFRNCVVKPNISSDYYPDGLTSILSSYPVAYVLHNGSNTCGLVDLFSFCSKNINDEVIIPVDFSSAFYPGQEVSRDYRWPFNVGDNKNEAKLVLTTDASFQSSLIGLK